MKKNKDNSQKQRKENVYIVLPRLDVMLSACDNCKLKAHFANMEYSNFIIDFLNQFMEKYGE